MAVVNFIPRSGSCGSELQMRNLFIVAWLAYRLLHSWRKGLLDEITVGVPVDSTGETIVAACLARATWSSKNID